MSIQYGFYYDADRCIQCRTCELACKSIHDSEPGIRRRRVAEEWGGTYPLITRTFFSLSCMHCEKAACAAACPTGAISKRDEDGIVVVDRGKCNGCRDCLRACPYAVPQFDTANKMQMCDYCTGIGRTPVCVESCPSEALQAGPLDELLASASRKAARRMEGPTGPSLVIAGRAPTALVRLPLKQ